MPGAPFNDETQPADSLEYQLEMALGEWEDFHEESVNLIPIMREITDAMQEDPTGGKYKSLLASLSPEELTAWNEILDLAGLPPEALE